MCLCAFESLFERLTKNDDPVCTREIAKNRVVVVMIIHRVG
jgi:hypothetical protein